MISRNIRLLAGPHDGRVIPRPDRPYCVLHEEVVYEYSELADDPDVWGLSRWEPYHDEAAFEVELQRLLRQV